MRNASIYIRTHCRCSIHFTIFDNVSSPILSVGSLCMDKFGADIDDDDEDAVFPWMFPHDEIRLPFLRKQLVFAELFVCVWVCHVIRWTNLINVIILSNNLNFRVGLRALAALPQCPRPRPVWVVRIIHLCVTFTLHRWQRTVSLRRITAVTFVAHEIKSRLSLLVIVNCNPSGFQWWQYDVRRQTECQRPYVLTPTKWVEFGASPLRARCAANCWRMDGAPRMDMDTHARDPARPHTTEIKMSHDERATQRRLSVNIVSACERIFYSQRTDPSATTISHSFSDLIIRDRYHCHYSVFARNFAFKNYYLVDIVTERCLWMRLADTVAQRSPGNALNPIKSFRCKHLAMGDRVKVTATERMVIHISQTPDTKQRTNRQNNYGKKIKKWKKNSE